MKNFTVINTPHGIKVAEFPNAAKIIEVPAARAGYLISLSLHSEDLEFALECITAMNEVPSDARVLHKALWRTALVHFYKCFHSGVRTGLDAEQIFSKERDRELALEVFEYYKHVRDKHVVHDVNHMTQGVAGAVLNDGHQSFKVEQIVCATGLIELIDDTSFGNLQKLISTSLSWVHQSFDTECKNITSELENYPYDELLSQPAALMPQEIEVTRKSIKASREKL